MVTIRERQRVARPRAAADAADHQQFRFIVGLWFLYLWAPAKLIAFYVPPARPITWLPELGLWICAIRWLTSSVKTRPYPAYTAFFCVMVGGTLVAFLIGNAGIARDILRHQYQFFLLGLLTLAYCTTPLRARAILGVYFGYFVWYGLWGLISLKVSPLADAANPGARAIIYWHPTYDNRDAFGPLMVAGLAYSVYYLQGTRAVGSGRRTAAGVLGIALGILGFITSFGRGAFVGFLTTATSMWLRSRNKLAALAIAATIVGGFMIVAPQLTAKYLASMQTITTEGTEEGTGADRMGLWGVAWREFLWSPVVGVGTANYGIATQRVVKVDEEVGHGYTQGRLWGRACHSTPMTILSEYGLVGAIIALWLVIDFFNANRRIRRLAKQSAGTESNDKSAFPPGYVLALALGLNAVFLTFIISGIFYEIIYTPIYYNVIVLNRMLYFAAGADAEPSGEGRRGRRVT
jgi:hypothetical protein